MGRPYEARTIGSVPPSVDAYNVPTDNASDSTSSLNAYLSNAGDRSKGEGVTLPTGTFWISSPLHFPEGVLSDGNGREHTVIKALPNFSGTYMAFAGYSNPTANTHGCRIANVTFHCNDVAGLSALYANSLQEESGFEHILVKGCQKYGLLVEDANGGTPANWYADDLEIILSEFSPSGAGGIYIKNNGSSSLPRAIERTTVTVRDAATNLASSFGVRSEVYARIFHTHVERMTDAVVVGGTGSEVDGLVAKDCGTNAVRILDGVGVNAFKLSSIMATGTTPNTLSDIDRGITRTAGQLIEYEVGNGGIGSQCIVDMWTGATSQFGSLATGASGTVRTGRGVTGSRPSASAVGAGAMWWDSTLKKPIWSDGTNWLDATGATV